MRWVGHSDPHLLIRCYPRPSIAWRKASYSRRALPPKIPTRGSCDGCCAPAQRGCVTAAVRSVLLLVHGTTPSSRASAQNLSKILADGRVGGQNDPWEDPDMDQCTEEARRFMYHQ